MNLLSCPSNKTQKQQEVKCTMANSKFKIYTFISALAGIATALGIASCVVVYLVKDTDMIKSPKSSPAQEYYDDELVPYFRANLEEVTLGELGYEPEADSPTEEITPLGQHINQNGDVVFLGKTADDFEPNYGQQNDDSILLNKMIRKLQISVTPKNLIPDKSTLDAYKKDSTYIDYVATSLNIVGLDTLNDGNSMEIANELRFAILGFVKVYMGLLNLNEVQVVPNYNTDQQLDLNSDQQPTASSISKESFTLKLPNGLAYDFIYSLDLITEEVSNITVTMAKGE